MSDDAVDYGGTGSSDAESESDQVPSESRLPARAESFKVWAHDLSVLRLRAGLVDILQMIVGPCLCDGKEAVTVEQLKAIYPEEAKNVALDIRTNLGELALQHQASAQHQHPKPKPAPGCRCVFFGPGPSFLG